MNTHVPYNYCYCYAQHLTYRDFCPSLSQVSFEHVMGWMRDINTRAPPDVDVVLCANKNDVEDRAVTYDEGAALAEEFGISFFEVSAKTGQNV